LAMFDFVSFFFLFCLPHACLLFLIDDILITFWYLQSFLQLYNQGSCEYGFQPWKGI
jgi:hypothetical protein